MTQKVTDMCPPSNRRGIRVEHQFRGVEKFPLLRIVRSRNAEAVQLPGTDAEEVGVTGKFDALLQGDAVCLLFGVQLMEETEFDSFRVERKQGIINPLAVPCGS